MDLTSIAKDYFLILAFERLVWRTVGLLQLRYQNDTAEDLLPDI